MNTTKKRRLAVSVLNSCGSWFAVLVVGYDRFQVGPVWTIREMADQYAKIVRRALRRETGR